MFKVVHHNGSFFFFLDFDKIIKFGKHKLGTQKKKKVALRWL